jgi:alanyl-tRNA synthetase
MELCGGTHTRTTGEIGLFRITGESAIAAGVRRIEANAGLIAAEQARVDAERITTLAERLNSPVKGLEKKIEQALEQTRKLEKQLKSLQQTQAKNTAQELIAKSENAGGVSFIKANLGATDGNFAQAVTDALKTQFDGVVVVGATENGRVTLVASVPETLTGKVQAGHIIQAIAPIVGGKGGGKPTQARGGGKDANKLDDALAEVPKILTS